MRVFPPALIFLIAACSAQEAVEDNVTTEALEAAPITIAEEAAPQLEPLWIASGFSSPEGVAEAPDGGFFISNVAGDATDKDGEGWISILSEEGEVIEARFADGLNAPKGMAVLDGALYVADIDTVRIYNAVTGDALSEVVIVGAEFLNDAAAWQGAVYVSDSRTARIFRVSDGAATVWSADEKLGGVNGLLDNGEKLLISTMDTGSLYEADIDGVLTEIANGMIDADGIGVVPGGGWLVSAWRGDIFFVSPEGEVTKLMDTRKEEILQNDLSVFGNLVVVPNWQPGTVTAWRIVR